MILVVCTDDHFGMLFNGRRQSKDRNVRADILNVSSGSRLWMNSYSAAQFDESADHICVDENYLEHADPSDYCFVENVDIADYADRVTGVILYRWNRNYPRDTYFPAALFEGRWLLKSREDICGYSHEMVTREVYIL